MGLPNIKPSPSSRYFLCVVNYNILGVFNIRGVGGLNITGYCGRGLWGLGF